MVDPLSYFSFQSVIHDWCNIGRGISYPVCGMIDAYKITLAAKSERVAYVAAAGFLSRNLNDSQPSVRRHITVNKNVLSAR